MKPQAPVAEPLGSAIESYLGWAVVHAFKPGSGTPRTYRIKLNMYAKRLGHETPVKDITGQQWYNTCGSYWAAASPETYNSGRRAAISFLKFCRDSEPPLSAAQPPRLWTPRPVSYNGSRAIPQTTMTSLFDEGKYPLRERALWSLLYDSSERLSAILTLDVQDLDLKACIASLRVKGGNTRYIAWTPETSLLLLQLIGDRETGPVFVGEIQPWNWRERPDSDRGPRLPSGRGYCYRLTAHRARILFKELTGVGKLHRIRHTRLSNLGSSEKTNSAMLKAISGHLTDKMVAHYSKPGPEEVAAFMAQVGSLMA